MTAIQIDEGMLRAWPLPVPGDDADKEARGRVVIVAGSQEIPGAAVLAGRAALRAGAGKVLIATVDTAALAVAIAVPEARVIGLQSTRDGEIGVGAAERILQDVLGADACLIGPGMQDESQASALAHALLSRCPDVPAIVDAGAMGCVKAMNRRVLLTPHMGEMAHLIAHDKAFVAADAAAVALAAAQHWDAVVALKGATTIIAQPQGQLWEHEGGQAGLATAGSGDVLAGLIAGLLARGAGLEQAAAWGVFVHAQAGRRLARRVGRIGYLASELAAKAPAILDAMS